MQIDVLSLFPKYIEGPLQESMIKRAITNGLLHVSNIDIRHFSPRKDSRVDDRSFGGGPGMVLMAEPVASAIRSCRTPSSHVIYLTPQGNPLTPKRARELSTLPHLILVCGHYEGIDQRVLESDIDEEISIGDYVLTNGCLAALVLIDVVARFIPGVLGAEEGAEEDSFEKGIFDHPHYTQPRVFEGKEVPEVLLGGDHAKIAQWRRQRALERTKEIRPDLVAQTFFSPSQQKSEGFCLSQIVEPSFYFDEAIRFYEHILGIPPKKDAHTAVFSCKAYSLTLQRIASPISGISTMIALSVPSEIFPKAISWCRRTKGRVIQEPSVEGNSSFAILKDPDGRLIKLSST